MIYRLLKPLFRAPAATDNSTPTLLHSADQKRRFDRRIILVLLATLPVFAWAIKPSDTPLEKRLQHSPSVDDIARKINQQRHWRILAAEPTVEDEKTLYRFKLLNKKRGRVQVIVIDPNEPNFKKLQ